MTKFFRCEKCGKILIEQLPGGLFRFRFGKNPDNSELGPPVEIIAYGPLQMRCIRKSCRRKYPDHWNKIAVFPVLDS